MRRVLIVSDQPEESRSLMSALEQDQYEVMRTAGLEEIRQIVGSMQVDVILTNEELREGTALDVLALARVADEHVGVLLLCASSTPAAVAESMQAGFFELLVKPIANEVLRAATRRASDRAQLLRENSRLKAELVRRNGHADPMSLSWVETLPPSFDMRTFLAAVEKTLIERTLQATRGAQAEAARRLGLSRSDLSYKLLKYELRKETSAAS